MQINVDHRDHFPPIRDQGQRSTCLAFAVSAVHCYYQRTRNWLSVEYLFYYAMELEPIKNPDLGITFVSIKGALLTHGQPSENDWPYQGILDGVLPVPPLILNCLRHDSIWELHSDPNKIFNEVQISPIVVAVKLTDDFFKTPSSPFLIDETKSEFGDHAIVGIGVGTDQKGDRWLLIRNSWGTDWGDSGEAWMSESYLTLNLIGHMKLI